MSQRISIIIPTWNNLPFLQLCVRSIRQNSAFDHQIVVHVNDGSDGTLQWVQEQGLDYTHTPDNVGVCMACNMMRTKVQCDYILYVNDDMYLLPGWDTVLLDEIAACPDNMYYLSGTMIQPHSRLDVGITANYGDSIDTFDEQRLLSEYKTLTKEDWTGATWPPSLMHRDVWDLIGGFSIEYTPGMYSDPDIAAKLYMVGVRHFKGLANCRVYHFECKSTGRVKRNKGNIQFLLKWGITNSAFRRNVTLLGLPYNASSVSTPNSKTMCVARLRSRLKALWLLITGKQFGPIR